METIGDLRIFPEDWDTALFIMAHPDDVEYPSAAPVAKWTSSGKTVIYLFASRGEAGIDNICPEDAIRCRSVEQMNAAKAVGVRDVRYLDHPDGMIEPTLSLRRDIARVIREVRPECVIVGGYRERIGNGKLNMSDHRAVGLSAVDAVRDASNRWVFTDLDCPAWSGVRHVAQHGSPYPTHVVDCFSFYEQSVESLLCHQEYLASLGTSEADVRAMLFGHHESISRRCDGIRGIGFEMVDGPESGLHWM